jgi:glycosyltransferase involved in cell wall biosynthesis
MSALPRQRKTRVVLVCEAAGGGVGKHVLDVAERLPSLGFEVLVAHCTRRAEPEFADRLARHAEYGYRVALVDVDRAPGPRDVVGVMQLRRAVREFGGADVMHGHSAKGGALARLARWRRAERVFYTPHAFYAQAPSLSATGRRLYGFAEHALALATDRIIATSHEELGLARSLGIPAHKLTVVENGILVRGEAELTRARALARTTLGIGMDECVVGFVGRMVAQKAPVRAIETFARLWLTNQSTRFVLVGDGPEASAVEAALQDTGLTGHVRWVRRGVGHELLPAMDVLLVTSHYEGFSYVMLEALDSGCAIVTTPVGGARDCVVDGRNGTIVASSTPDALARAVSEFVGSSERLAAARAVSRERARDFEIDRMVDRLVTLYRGAVDDAA